MILHKKSLPEQPIHDLPDVHRLLHIVKIGLFRFLATLPTVPKQKLLRIPMDFDESLALAMQVKPEKKPAKPAKAAKAKKNP